MKFLKMFFYDADKGGEGGGAEQPKSDPMKDANDKIAALSAKIEELLASSKPKADPTLNDKVKDINDQKDKTENDTRALEQALSFNLKSDSFLKDNEKYLPSNVAQIFKVAETEKYDSAIQKASATKAAIMQEFFSIQDNVDFLTSSQKSKLDDYLKMTKDGKEREAQKVYVELFEPTLEQIKRIKKAEQVGRANSHLGDPSDADERYKKRMIELSQKHFMGVK
jgi:hypothetical protein